MMRLAFCFFAVFAAVSSAAEYPSKPIHLVIPFGAGSGTDVVMRVILPVVSEGLGQPIVIDPRPGADGAISGTAIARAAPDGYTLGIGTGGTLAIVPAIRKNPPYDPIGDFTPITDVVRFTNFLFINSSVPAKNFQEFVAYVKANPGKLAYGTGQPAGIVAWAQIKVLVGLDMLHVPYKSAPNIIPDLLSNRVQAMIDSPIVALPHVREGKLRVIVTTLNRRSSLLPDVPTINEAGVPKFTIVNWAGLVGPAKLPREIVDRLNHEFGVALRKPEVIAALEKQAVLPSPSASEQFAALIKEQVETYRGLLRSASVQSD